MGSQPPPFHTRPPGGKRWEQHGKVWGSVGARPGQRPPFCERFSRFPGCVSPTLHLELPGPARVRPGRADALSAGRAAPGPGRLGRRSWASWGLHPEEKDLGRRAQRDPARERAGGVGAGKEPEGPPLRAAGKRPVLPADGRTDPADGRTDAGITPLVSFALPQTENPRCLGNCPSSTWQGKMRLWSQMDLGSVAA